MELDALLDRVEEAVRHPEALSRLTGVEDRLNAAVTFHAPLWATVRQFGHAKNFGSLIVPKVADASGVLEQVRAADMGGDMMLTGTRERVVAVLRMAEALAPRYHVVVANPPYAGSSGLNDSLQAFSKRAYPNSFTDLFTMFIDRSLALTLELGMTAMVTIQNWMFLGSFEKLREDLIRFHRISRLVQIGYNSFPELNSKVVQAAAFVIEKSSSDRSGIFVNANDAPQSANKEVVFKERLASKSFFFSSADDFSRVPGSPIAYWLSDASVQAFSEKDRALSLHANLKEGLTSGDNEKYLRAWHEVAFSSSSSSGRDAFEEGKTWTQHRKGGEYRKWYGNNDFFLYWKGDGATLKSSPTSLLRAQNLYFQEALSWSRVTSGEFAIRYYPAGQTFDSTAPSLFSDAFSLMFCAAFLNSPVVANLLRAMSPTLDFRLTSLGRLPFLNIADKQDIATRLGSRCIDLARVDWDAYETSWDFTTLPLLSPDHRSGTLETTYAHLRAHWAGMTAEMQRLEEENNRIFIDAYGLQDELTPEVPIEEITLTCNPAYSIKGDLSDETREARLRERTVKEFISYAIGCMFGRYSLDAPGLILANQGDTLQDYLARIPEPTFTPDADNIIPVLGDDRFEDDAYVRFRTFLSLTFGPDQLDENLAFVREALGESVRDYLAKRFFDDHVTRYKKRPIYWLVSSPKGAFQALIYMHRYNPDTLNTVLTRYVRPLRDRLEAAVRAAEGDMITASATAALRNKAQKEIDRLNKQITELTDWERDHLYPMALQRIPIDLDDGVKRNYPLFDGVMRAVKGMAADE